MNTIGEKKRKQDNWINKKYFKFPLSIYLSISNLQFYLLHTQKPRTRLEGISIKANTDMMREKWVYDKLPLKDYKYTYIYYIRSLSRFRFYKSESKTKQSMNY